MEATTIGAIAVVCSDVGAGAGLARTGVSFTSGIISLEQVAEVFSAEVAVAVGCC